MSLYQKASLVQIPSGYKAADDKLYSVVPNNGDGDFTVTVDADATRVNKDGLIESVAADQARLNYDFTNPQDPHLLLEPSRTNTLTYSEDFTNSVWSKQGTSSVSGNTTIAPDGSLTADTLSGATGTSVSGTVLRRNVSGTVDATLSIYVKSLGSTSFTVYMRNGSNGQVQSQSITPNDNWQRVTLTYNPNNGQIYFGNTNGDVAIWGAQLEEGNYATSYIPTISNAEVTRTVDTCGTSDTNLINNTEGVLFADFDFSEQGTVSSYQIAIGLYNTGGTGSQNVRIDNYSGKLRIYIVSPSGTRAVWDANNSISNVVANQRYKVAIRYKNGYSASYVNGELYKSDSGGAVSGFDLVKMVFGFANFGNTVMHRGKMYQAMVFNEALSDSELITLTS